MKIKFSGKMCLIFKYFLVLNCYCSFDKCLFGDDKVAFINFIPTDWSLSLMRIVKR